MMDCCNSIIKSKHGSDRRRLSTFDRTDGRLRGQDYDEHPQELELLEFLNNVSQQLESLLNDNNKNNNNNNNNNEDDDEYSFRSSNSQLSSINSQLQPQNQAHLQPNKANRPEANKDDAIPGGVSTARTEVEAAEASKLNDSAQSLVMQFDQRQHQVSPLLRHHHDQLQQQQQQQFKIENGQKFQLQPMNHQQNIVLMSCEANRQTDASAAVFSVRNYELEHSIEPLNDQLNGSAPAAPTTELTSRMNSNHWRNEIQPPTQRPLIYSPTIPNLPASTSASSDQSENNETVTDYNNQSRYRQIIVGPMQRQQHSDNDDTNYAQTYNAVPDYYRNNSCSIDMIEYQQQQQQQQQTNNDCAYCIWLAQNSILYSTANHHL